MANEIGKTDALVSLKPKAEWTLRGDELEWHDLVQTEPTQSEIDAEVTRLQAVYDSQAYARSRQQEYPSIQECVHAILDDDLTALQVLRQAVKDKYPK
jgi:hypothetical protein